MRQAEREFHTRALEAAGLPLFAAARWGGRLLFCCALPYCAGTAAGELSLYTRGRDYHQVFRERFAPAAERLGRETGRRFAGFADAAPFNERTLAARAGLGVRGENGLLFLPGYGSYVFLGELVEVGPDGFPPETEAEPLWLSPARAALPAGENLCTGCGRCRAACPVKADALPPGDRCLSAVTQRRGALTPAEAALVRQNGLLWGCDACQRCCPANRDARRTDDPAFREDLLTALPPEAFSLSDRAFRTAYAGRAFTWRGLAPLRRNRNILDGTESRSAAE